MKKGDLISVRTFVKPINADSFETSLIATLISKYGESSNMWYVEFNNGHKRLEYISDYQLITELNKQITIVDY